MHIYINSEYKDIPDNITTVSKLLDYLKIKTQGTGVGINNHLVVARNWNSAQIKEDDRIMIISATYGG